LKLSYIENPIWPFTFLRTKPKVKVVNWGGVGLRWIRLRRGYSILKYKRSSSKTVGGVSQTNYAY
jgi:hypothetical protein